MSRRRRTRRPEYTLVIPRTHRAGPGTRSHLSPDGGKTTLCKVENNAHGLRRLGFGIRPSRDVASLEKQAARQSCRYLCANCRRLAGRRA